MAFGFSEIKLLSRADEHAELLRDDRALLRPELTLDRAVLETVERLDNDALLPERGKFDNCKCGMSLIYTEM